MVSILSRVASRLASVGRQLAGVSITGVGFSGGGVLKCTVDKLLGGFAVLLGGVAVVPIFMVVLLVGVAVVPIFTVVLLVGVAVVVIFTVVLLVGVAVVPICTVVGGYCVPRANISMGIGSVVVSIGSFVMSIRSVVVCMSSFHIIFASVGLGRGQLGGLLRFMGIDNGSMRRGLMRLIVVMRRVNLMNISLVSVRICLGPVFLSSGIVDVSLRRVSLRMGALAICLFVVDILSLTMGSCCEGMLFSRSLMSITQRI